MSNVTRGLWFLHFRGCQSLGPSKILLRKENGSGSSTQVYRCLQSAWCSSPECDRWYYRVRAGKGPSDQHGLGSFTSHCYISSHIPSQGGEEDSLDLKAENAPCCLSMCFKIFVFELHFHHSHTVISLVTDDSQLNAFSLYCSSTFFFTDISYLELDLL